LAARVVRRVVRESLDLAAAQVPDPVPAEIVEAHGLGTLEQALREIHFPGDEAELERARRRRAFAELCLLQTVLELRRRMLSQEGRGLISAGPGALAARAEAA